MIRKAAVAGSFYPFNKNTLTQTIEKCFSDPDFGPGILVPNTNDVSHRSILGGVCPHAGYSYSGPAAAHTIKAIFEDKCPESVIILGTQHTGYRGISLMKDGSWEIPLGNVEIDTSTAKNLLEKSNLIREDEAAFSGFHSREHNIEVQLPFLHFAASLYNREITIVPIKIGDMNLQHLEEIGNAIGKVISSSNKDIAVIASSDMTHKQPQNYYQPADDLMDMKRRDQAVCDAILKYNWSDAYENALQTSVCGPQTITTSMVACKELGANESQILKYYTSYEKTGGKGPCEYSVGYLSAIFTR